MHFRGRFLRDTNEGHKLQPLRLSWNLTCHCQSHFWTHSMHFRRRFPRDTKPNPSDCPGIWRAFVNYISEHIPSIFGVGFRGTRNPIPPIALKFGRFLRDTNEGHKLQPLRLSWNLTCHCQLHFWTHSMHFWGRFPRDTKPNPYDCPEIWRAMANYIFKRIPCIFVVGFWFLNIFHAFLG